MRKLLILCFLLLAFISCNDSKVKPEPVTLDQTPGIAEENDLCICTKEFMPVCGSDGVTYGNKCEAQCKKVSSFTEGACK